jgi:hypothetical protein
VRKNARSADSRKLARKLHAVGGRNDDAKSAGESKSAKSAESRVNVKNAGSIAGE